MFKLFVLFCFLQMAFAAPTYSLSPKDLERLKEEEKQAEPFKQWIHNKISEKLEELLRKQVAQLNAGNLKPSDFGPEVTPSDVNGQIEQKISWEEVGKAVSEPIPARFGQPAQPNGPKNPETNPGTLEVTPGSPAESITVPKDVETTPPVDVEHVTEAKLTETEPITEPKIETTGAPEEPITVPKEVETSTSPVEIVPVPVEKSTVNQEIEPVTVTTDTTTRTPTTTRWFITDHLGRRVIILDEKKSLGKDRKSASQDKSAVATDSKKVAELPKTSKRKPEKDVVDE